MFSINLPNPFGGKDSRPVGSANHTPLAVGLLIVLLVTGLFLVFSAHKSN